MQALAPQDLLHANIHVHTYSTQLAHHIVVHVALTERMVALLSSEARTLGAYRQEAGPMLALGILLDHTAEEQQRHLCENMSEPAATQADQLDHPATRAHKHTCLGASPMGSSECTVPWCLQILGRLTLAPQSHQACMPEHMQDCTRSAQVWVRQ